MSILQIKHLTVGAGPPKLIIPLVGNSKVEILKEAESIRALHPDVVEWRVDLFDQVEDLQAVENVIHELKVVLAGILILFTFRTHLEGGNKVISDDFYTALNQTAIQTRSIDLVDVELFKGEQIINSILSVAKENQVFVVMSNHDFDKTPNKDEIVSRLRAMQDYGADIPKIAVMPTSVEDVLTLLEATHLMNTKYAIRPIITMSMGRTGLISRIVGEQFGSAFTFGSGEEASAPGQIPAEELRTILTILHRYHNSF